MVQKHTFVGTESSAVSSHLWGTPSLFRSSPLSFAPGKTLGGRRARSRSFWLQRNTGTDHTALGTQGPWPAAGFSPMPGIRGNGCLAPHSPFVRPSCRGCRLPWALQPSASSPYISGPMRSFPDRCHAAVCRTVGTKAPHSATHALQPAGHRFPPWILHREARNGPPSHTPHHSSRLLLLLPPKVDQGGAGGSSGWTSSQLKLGVYNTTQGRNVCLPWQLIKETFSAPCMISKAYETRPGGTICPHWKGENQTSPQTLLPA